MGCPMTCKKNEEHEVSDSMAITIWGQVWLWLVQNSFKTELFSPRASFVFESTAEKKIGTLTKMHRDLTKYDEMLRKMCLTNVVVHSFFQRCLVVWMRFFFNLPWVDDRPQRWSHVFETPRVPWCWSVGRRCWEISGWSSAICLWHGDSKQDLYGFVLLVVIVCVHGEYHAQETKGENVDMMYMYIQTYICIYIYIHDCTDMFTHMHAQYVYQKDDTLLWIYWREAVCVTEYNQPSKVPMEMSGNLAFAFHALNTIG